MATTHKQFHSQTQPASQQASLSRSTSTSSSHGHLRPKSRGSTASLQSVGVGNAFQPVQPSQEYAGHVNTQATFASNFQRVQTMSMPGDAHLGQYQPMPNMRPQMMPDVPLHIAQQEMRPMSRQDYHDLRPVPVQFSGGMSAYNMPHQVAHHGHMRHASEQYEGSPAPDDSQNENGGMKKRRGTTSSMANDQELRRLLTQYKGRTLGDVAAEVQKNEGTGGKSEKAKQVFAMLWLQATCKRSTNSVRRDKVFARYTERCGNERVPTLNPASFGKLVRIIFPNVQTRRLGVRGESKYHYVDLSLVPDENHPDDDRPSTSHGAPERPTSAASIHRSVPNNRSLSLNTLPPRMAMETADFPAPSLSHVAKPQRRDRKRTLDTRVTRLDCLYANTPLIRIARHNMATSLVNALPAVRSTVPGTIATYMAMPSPMMLHQPPPNLQDNPIELPDIHEYLAGEHYDFQLAKLLQDLYRSYCIDVIDAFRKCKDKSFFAHHSAYNGKMTVPVSKIFTMESVAPWIHECDMRMYKQILRYMTQLVLQVVPDAVWNAFDRISSRLVSHIVASFEEKCPPHVVVAKVVPAARFTSLLKKLQLAQAATVSASRILDQPSMGTQMWLDMLSMCDPEALITDSTPPPESVAILRGLLKTDVRALLSPLPDALVPAAESDPSAPFSMFYRECPDGDGVLPQTATLPQDMIGRIVLWLENLAYAFEGHHPQCMVDWTTRFFRCIMTQICQSNGMSYQAWWCMDNFTSQMLAFMTQLAGFLLPVEIQKTLDAREVEKNEEFKKTMSLQIDSAASSDSLPEDPHTSGSKRKRDATDVDDGSRNGYPSAARQQTPGSPPKSAVTTSFSEAVHNLNLNLVPPTQRSSAELVNVPTITTTHEHITEEHLPQLDDHDDMAEINGPTLDLPTFRTGFTSPMKPMHELHGHVNNPKDSSQLPHDDSGIGLSMLGDGVHDDDNNEMTHDKEVKKFNNRDWFLSSDPVQPVGQGVGA